MSKNIHGLHALGISGNCFCRRYALALRRVIHPVFNQDRNSQLQTISIFGSGCKAFMKTDIKAHFTYKFNANERLGINWKHVDVLWPSTQYSVAEMRDHRYASDLPHSTIRKISPEPFSLMHASNPGLHLLAEPIRETMVKTLDEETHVPNKSGY
jgi:hypothetical protein